jgi:DNA-binding NarL/FixJ family response regulator
MEFIVRGICDFGEPGVFMAFEETADGLEAVQLPRQLRPDVVLMDVSMPSANGIDATRQIVSEFPTIRIIGLSIHEEADMAAAMCKAGPTDVLIAAIRAR